MRVRSVAVGALRVLHPPDPLARVLTWSSMAASLSSGLFYPVSAVFFTRVIGLDTGTVGWGLTVAGAVGVVGSFAAGYLADRVGAHRLLLGASVGQGLALLAYAQARGTLAFVVIAAAVIGMRSMQGTARSTLLARCFPGPDRVAVRAGLRVITNVFMALGSVLAAVALVLDTDGAYVVTVLLVGLLVLCSGVPLLRLGRLVRERVGPDASPHPASPASPASAPAAPGASASGGSGRSPLRDRTYLGVTGLNTVMAMQFGLQSVGVPLWITTGTQAPLWMVSVALLLNTVLVSAFQVPLARGTHDVPTAGRAVARAGVLLAAACVLFAFAGQGDVVSACVLLVLAVVLAAVAEMLAEAGGWGLAFELADPHNAGAYQGVSQTGYAIAAMLAPVVVTWTAVEHGTVGWVGLGALFALAGVATMVLARRSHRPPAAVA